MTIAVRTWPTMAAARTGIAARRAPVSFAAVVAAGCADGVLVGRDGSPGWQALRVLGVAVVAVAAAYALTRPHALVRGAVAFPAGIIATAAGCGVALPHLTNAGWSVAAAAGLLSAAGGLVLAGTGATWCVRATRRWWRLLVVPALVVFAWVGLWAMTLAVVATNVPPTRVSGATPAQLGLEYRDVLFPTADGVLLSGWYVPSANGAAVVLLHGSGSTRTAALDHAAVLAGHGYGVLLFDARGHGRSGGRAMDFGWYGDRDARAAVSFLLSRPEVDPGRIGAVGLSMGGEEAIGAGAADARIRAVVAEGAVNRVSGDKAFLSEAYGVRGRLQRGIEWLTYGIADLLTDASPPGTLRDAAAAMSPRPLLLITAGTVPEERFAAGYIRRGAPDTVSVWQVPGAAHTGGLGTVPLQWKQHVLGFLDTALRPA